MNEYQFDLGKWLEVFPQNVCIGEEDVFAVVTASPFHAATIHYIRELVSKAESLGPSIPTDVFIVSEGEPDRRDVTKVGGVPYRPANLPWPSFEGKPLTFLAQFRFTESRDLVGDTPGDVLLVFADEAVPSEMVFEWYPLGLSDLIDSSQIPKPAWQFVTCYGVRYRTVDLPFSQSAIRNRFPDADFAHVYLSMKIGGIPAVMQGELFRNLEKQHGREIKTLPEWPSFGMPGRYLCALSSILPKPGVPYPFVNRERPYPLLRRSVVETEKTTLQIADAGSLYFWLDDDGQTGFWAESF